MSSSNPFDWEPASGATARGRARYSRWDGSQRPDDLHADDLIDALADDILADGDVEEALRRLLERGMLPRPDGSGGLTGLRELMRRLAERRREVLERHGLRDVFGDLRRQLDEIVDTERRGIERRLRADEEGSSGDVRADAGPIEVDAAQQEEQGASPGPRGSGEQGTPPEGGADDVMRRRLRDMARRHQETLANMPSDVGERIRALEQYEFLEPAARDAFGELLERLRGRMLDATFSGLADRLRSMTPAELQQTRQMVQELQRLLEQKLVGGDPDASDFLRRYGELFPGARSLDDVIEQLRQRMAAMQSLLRSMSAAQREELGSLMDALLRDDRLRYDLAKLGATLDRLLPDGLGERFPFRGDDQLGLEEALDEVGELGRLDRLSEQLASAEPPALSQVDPDEIRRLLGEESAEDLAALRRAAKELEEAGYVSSDGERMELTPHGQRRIGQRILDAVFGRLRRDALGGHALRQAGGSGERSGSSAQYEFGRPFDLDLRGTLDAAVRRERSTVDPVARRPGMATGGRRGTLRLAPDDFQVFEAEEATSAATVLLLDMSRSMLLRGCFLAAKKVAVALDTLIRIRYPRDVLHVVGFAYVAREIPAGSLASLSWQGHEYGTNLQHALMLGRRLLSRGAPSNRSIVVITDGEPTAHIEDGRVEFNYPPTRRTVEETLREVGRCTRDGITINTFMLERSRALGEFVDRLTRMNRGRAFYASPEHLEEFVLVDYLERRTKRVA